MGGKKQLIAGLNTQADHPATGCLHQLQQLKVEMLGPGRTIKGHTERLVYDHPAEIDNPLTIEGELVIVEIQVPEAVGLFQIEDMAVKVIGRVIAEGPAENRAVAIAASVGAAAAGDTAAVRGLWIVEDRQGVGLRVASEFGIVGKRQAIQVEEFFRRPVKKAFPAGLRSTSPSTSVRLSSGVANSSLSVSSPSPTTA